MNVAWWQWLPIHPWRIVGDVESADDIPDRLPRNGIALVASGGALKWIAFDCPCRTGHRIMLNADKRRVPYWTLRKSTLATISPSIDFQGHGRRCHYFVRNGRIEWTKDSNR